MVPPLTLQFTPAVSFKLTARLGLGTRSALTCLLPKILTQNPLRERPSQEGALRSKVGSGDWADHRIHVSIQKNPPHTMPNDPYLRFGF
jgi:hypothetical protein